MAQFKADFITLIFSQFISRIHKIPPFKICAYCRWFFNFQSLPDTLYSLSERKSFPHVFGGNLFKTS